MPHDLSGEVDLPQSTAMRLKAWLQTPDRTAYHLTWEGSKIPRDAEINGKKVQNVSNRYVSADPFGDDIIGTYIRVERPERENPREQEIVVLAPAPGEEIEVH